MASTAMKTSAELATPTDLKKTGTAKIAQVINILVADAFSLYFKTKNFHWHMSGPNFRDYHILLDEHADQIFATIDPLAERVRKLGHTTLRTVSEITELRNIKDSADTAIPPLAMLQELLEDNRSMAKSLREAHAVCDDYDDIATASLIEVYLDETERRIWFLFETTRAADRTGH
ncbi:MAG: DNA starvation/stationary phase protection protein [Hyphomicrobiaceae bacterium]